LIADLDYLRMEDLPHPSPERNSAWRMLRIPTGGIEHVGGPFGRLASVR
jgi:hypothetical protein